MTVLSCCHCPELLSVAAVKHWPKSTQGWKGLLGLYAIGGSQGRSWRQEPGETPVSGLLKSLSSTTQAHLSRGWHHPQNGSSYINQQSRKSPVNMPTSQLMETIPQLRCPLPRCVQVCVKFTKAVTETFSSIHGGRHAQQGSVAGKGIFSSHWLPCNADNECNT